MFTLYWPDYFIVKDFYKWTQEPKGERTLLKYLRL